MGLSQNEILDFLHPSYILTPTPILTIKDMNCRQYPSSNPPIAGEQVPSQLSDTTLSRG